MYQLRAYQSDFTHFKLWYNLLFNLPFLVNWIYMKIQWLLCPHRLWLNYSLLFLQNFIKIPYSFQLRNLHCLIFIWMDVIQYWEFVSNSCGFLEVFFCSFLLLVLREVAKDKASNWRNFLLAGVSLGYFVIHDSLIMTNEEGMIFCDHIGKISSAGHWAIWWNTTVLLFVF